VHLVGFIIRIHTDLYVAIKIWVYLNFLFVVFLCFFLFYVKSVNQLLKIIL